MRASIYNSPRSSSSGYADTFVYRAQSGIVSMLGEPVRTRRARGTCILVVINDVDMHSVAEARYIDAR